MSRVVVNRCGMQAGGTLSATGTRNVTGSIELSADSVMTIEGYVGIMFSTNMVGEAIGVATPPLGQPFNPSVIVLSDSQDGSCLMVGEGSPTDGQNLELNWESSSGYHYGEQVVSGGGGGGTGSSEFEFTQSTPASTWTVNHNLGFRPDVSITSTGGLTVTAEVNHVNSMQLLIIFDIPFSGYVRCT